MYMSTFDKCLENILATKCFKNGWGLTLVKHLAQTDMSQYNKLSDIQNARFQILPVDLFWTFLISWYPNHVKTIGRQYAYSLFDNSSMH